MLPARAGEASVKKRVIGEGAHEAGLTSSGMGLEGSARWKWLDLCPDRNRNGAF